MTVTSVKQVKTVKDPLLEFAQFVAKMEVGCSPSPGFMEEIILKARKAIINQDDRLKNITKIKKEEINKILESELLERGYIPVELRYENGFDKVADRIVKLFAIHDVSGSFFKEIVILKADGVVLKTLQIIDHIPRTNNLMYIDGKQFQVTSNVFDYDLKCIAVWVASC